MAGGSTAPFNGAIGEGGAFIAQSSAPTNTDTLWLDTSDHSNGLLKRHDGSGWVPVGMVAMNYATTGDVPASDSGTLVFVTGDNSLYVDDGA